MPELSVTILIGITSTISIIACSALLRKFYLINHKPVSLKLIAILATVNLIFSLFTLSMRVFDLSPKGSPWVLSVLIGFQLFSILWALNIAYFVSQTIGEIKILDPHLYFKNSIASTLISTIVISIM